jgi:hypothetical protein
MPIASSGLRATGVLLLAAFGLTAASTASAQGVVSPSASAAPSAPPPPEPGDLAVSADHPAANSFYAEMSGAGLAYSVGYERMVVDDVPLRIGFSYLPVIPSGDGGGSAIAFTIPVTVSYTGVKLSEGIRLEIGVGTTLLYASAALSTIGATISGSGVEQLADVLLGVRVQPVNHAGLQVRAGLMLVAGEGLGLWNAPDPSALGLIPLPYASFGWSFGR